MNPQISERLRDCKNLPTLPAVAARIIRLCQDEDADLAELAQLISQDPALSSKVLRMVNSAYYGFAREIATIQHAVAILGIEVMQTVALTFSLLLGLRRDAGDGSSLHTFWRRSLLSAVAARCLARKMNRTDHEVLFLAALLQDIGILALREVLPRQYPVLQAQSRGEHWVLQGLENAELGMDHAEASAWLVGNWQLPSVYEAAIRASHDPEVVELDPAHREAARIVALSGLIADIWVMKDPFATAGCAMASAGRLLAMEEEDLRDLLKQVGRDMPGLSALYEMEVGDAESFDKVLEQLEEAGAVATRGGERPQEMNGVALPCTVEWGGEQQPGRVVSLSYRGAVVQGVAGVPPEASQVHLAFGDPQEAGRLEASITWRVLHEKHEHQGQLGRGSFGIQFAGSVQDVKIRLDPVFMTLASRAAHKP